MNFDYIEGLSENDIKELYNDILYKYTDENLISFYYCESYCVCPDGEYVSSSSYALEDRTGRRAVQTGFAIGGSWECDPVEKGTHLLSGGCRYSGTYYVYIHYCRP